MFHNYQISFASEGNLQIPIVQKTLYGKKYICWLYGYKNFKWYSERNGGCDVKHIFIS